MPEVLEVSAKAIDRMSLEELQDLADHVGVGYRGLEEAQLRKRLRFEATTKS